MAQHASRATDMLPEEVREILRRQVGDAARALRTKDISDEAVHKARKDLKRARAILRLLRAVVGKPAYARENAAMRDAARPLSAVRDAKVVADTLDALLEADQNAAHRALLVRLRQKLEKDRLAARRAISNGAVLDNSAASLEQAWQRIDRWRVSRNGARDVYESLGRIYRTGRKALSRTRKTCSPESLHEWRKQVKYLAQAVKIMESPGAGGVKQIVKRAEAIADALGDDHDLFVLEQKIASQASGAHNAQRALASGIEQRRRKLRSKALKKGRALYDLKPKEFVRRVRKDLAAAPPPLVAERRAAHTPVRRKRPAPTRAERSQATA